jgi:hypothetical protein
MTNPGSRSSCRRFPVTNVAPCPSAGDAMNRSASATIRPPIARKTLSSGGSTSDVERVWFDRSVDADNNRLLLRELSAVPTARRTARYRTRVVAVDVGSGVERAVRIGDVVQAVPPTPAAQAGWCRRT